MQSEEDFKTERSYAHNSYFPKNVDAEHMEKFHPDFGDEFSGHQYWTCDGCDKIITDFHDNETLYDGKTYEEGLSEEEWHEMFKLRARHHIGCGGKTTFHGQPWSEMDPVPLNQSHHLDHTGGWYGFEYDPNDHIHLSDGSIKIRLKEFS